MWTDRIRISFPADMIGPANHLAYLIDPDIGGGETFSSERVQSGRVVAQIPFIADFYPAVERRNPDEWVAMVGQLAAARNRQPMAESDIRALCAAMQIGDEVPDPDPLSEPDE